jgi:hypothetical protein
VDSPAGGRPAVTFGFVERRERARDCGVRLIGAARSVYRVSVEQPPVLVTIGAPPSKAATRSHRGWPT